MLLEALKFVNLMTILCALMFTGCRKNDNPGDGNRVKLIYTKVTCGMILDIADRRYESWGQINFTSETGRRYSHAVLVEVGMEHLANLTPEQVFYADIKPVGPQASRCKAGKLPHKMIQVLKVY